MSGMMAIVGGGFEKKSQKNRYAGKNCARYVNGL
jgi:hypothetical protein